jgi:CheY-like chemotaxis protein
VEPDPDGSAGWIRFNVVDTGIGIAAEKTEMIFGRFTQADSSTTRKYGGTGLGLAISKGLAELMGGRIGCSSEVGKGSTFFFTALFTASFPPEPGIRQEAATTPIASPAAVAIPQVEPAPFPQAARILIVDDDEFNVLLIKAYLADCGFELDVADNGATGVEKVKSGSPHVVLMDMQMPVMDGLDATRAIRAWEAETGARPVPILALTADALGAAVASSLQAGCNEHLTKPIKKEILREALARHLSGTVRVTPPEGLERLVPNYLTSVRRGMDQILEGVQSCDWTVARRLGHQLKGSGKGYGFPEITRAGAAVELAAQNTNDEEIRSQILALAAFLDRVEIVRAG